LGLMTYLTYPISALFLTILLKRDSERYTWGIIGLLLGVKGVILYLVYLAHKRHCKVGFMYKLNILKYLFSIQLFLTLIFICYLLITFYHFDTLGNLMSNLKDLGKNGDFLVKFPIHLFLSIWVFSIAKGLEVNKWFVTLLTLFLGVLSPILLMLYSLVCTEEQT